MTQNNKEIRQYQDVLRELKDNNQILNDLRRIKDLMKGRDIYNHYHIDRIVNLILDLDTIDISLRKELEQFNY